MDKNEYTLKVEEIKDLISRGQYAQAAEIADTIDWRKPRSARTLCIVSDLYKINRRYEDARDMLLLAYERRPGSRTICYSLCELSIKMEEYVQAIEYYKEFVQVAPKDPGRYILQYKLYEAQDVSLEERIAVLEELKKRDYREKWAYELAYLYHRVGLATRCVEECDELILWFGEGKYVIKAMELKMLHQPLTPEQQEKYNHRFDAQDGYGYVQNGGNDQNQETVQDGSYGESQGYAQDGSYDESQGYAQNGSYDENQGYVQDGSYDDGQGYAQNGGYDDGQGYVQNGGYDDGQGYAQDGGYDDGQGYVQDGGYDESQSYGQVTDDTRVYEPVQPQQPAQGQPAEDDFDIHVKTMDVGQYNTINLQAELAAGLREVLGDDQAKDQTKEKESSDSITRSIVAPMMGRDTETINYPEVPEEEEEAPAAQTEQMEGTEVFFGETGEIGDLSQIPKVETEELLPEEAQSPKKPDIVPEISEVQEPAAATEEIHEITAPTPIEAPVGPETPVEPPKELANVLAQESDGQISLVMPEAENIEKQITGQMNIEDILAEWERKKKENLEKREEEVRQHVLQQTGAMFTEFEQAVRDGLLEKLEKEKAADNDAATGTVEATDVGDITDTDEVEELEEVVETTEPEEQPAEETVSVEESEPEIIEEPEDVVEELEEEPVYEPETETEATEEPEEVLAPEPEEIEESASEEAPEEVAQEEDLETESGEEEELVEESAEEPVEETVSEEPQEAERPAVERDKAKVRALTREERELYAPFIQSKSAREQLVKAIDNISLAAYTGNVIITGEEGMDTLSLAKNMIREIQAEDSNFSGKVAKISGHALNKKDTAETLSRLKNGALIICKASEMNDATANALHKALQQESQGIVIILEDTKKEIDKFLAKHEKLRECFTARMDVEALSNDTLVAFGRQYAREMEYSIDELGVLALHTRIEDMQTIDHVVTVVDVKEIVDEAIAHANKKTLKHFFDVLFAKRYDDEDMIILTEKDFV